MVISRADRQRDREPRVRELFGKDAAAVLDLLELTELAWHDCMGEVTPPERVIDDILVCSQGDLATAISAARMAVQDFRDLRMWADDLAQRGGDGA